MGMTVGTSIIEAALQVLQEPDPHEKSRLTQENVQLWREGLLTMPSGVVEPRPPDRPAREDTKVKLVPSKDAPRRGKGGSLASRHAMLHSLVHIESMAVDLAWDIIARFGGDPSYRLPRAFFDDFVAVAEDECRHFLLLEARLEAEGSHYGALPAHDGLWESAAETVGSLGARLAVEHCTHEARGLDVLPVTIHRFRSNGDAASADLLQDVVYAEEISHCAAGVRWLKHLHAVAHGGQQDAGAPGQEQQQQEERGQGGMQQQQREQRPEQQGGTPEWVKEARRFPTVELWFHSLVRGHFHGLLKPPFNTEARAAAGFGPEWYLPLTVRAAAVPDEAHL